MRVYLGGKMTRLKAAMAIGKGGEAVVYRLPDGRALKLFKSPKHPDLCGFPAEQQAAQARIDEHQRKLRDFPAGLPDRVIAPEQLATDRDGRVVGYAMRLIDGAQLMMRLAEPRVRRRTMTGDQVVRVLRDLHLTVGRLHDAGVVIGDFNDLNVLVRHAEAYLIDADSYQFGKYRCAVFSDRFVDPLLCDPSASAAMMVAPHGRDSDWYAFAVMAMRSLLCVGPYGGVHKPKNRKRRVAHARRPLERVTVFDPEVVYPKPALHYGLLPEELLEHLRAVFIDDRRGPFPATLLDRLRFTRCSSCGSEHARPTCPSCVVSRPRIAPTVRVRGTVTARRVARLPDGIVDSLLSKPNRRRNGRHEYWLEGGSLMRDGALGPEPIGTVLEGHTRFWVGERFGIGFYAAGNLHVGFVFDAERRGINDQVALPPLRGRLTQAHCAVSDDRAWLLLVEHLGGKLVGHAFVIARDGSIMARAESLIDDSSWLAAGRTACAVGPYAFIARDEGIARLEVVGDQIALTRTFPDTEPFVDSDCQLHATTDGIYVVGREQILLLTL